MTSWDELLGQEREKEYFKNISQYLDGSNCYLPPQHQIFSAFAITPFNAVKVVILGQDPYSNGHASGLAFAHDGRFNATTPPSLRNIFKEIEIEFGKQPRSPNLVGWAAQGVLLLNTILTVEAGCPLSHKNLGWQTFTDRVIEELDRNQSPKVFVLWGNRARSTNSLIGSRRHLVLEAAHPSPLSASRGFFGCNHFKKANEFLEKHRLEPIDWINS
jgi:uracil-DNA glycosylase